MVARVAIVVGAQPGASSAGRKVRVQGTAASPASRSAGEVTGRPTRHSGSALPESMASLSDNGRAGRPIHGVRICDKSPRQRIIIAGRHVIIGFQREIYNSAPVIYRIVWQQQRYLSG
jgi:hypothetical protein